MNEKIRKMKSFVRRNKTKILVAALVVTTAGTALGFRNKRVTDEWLKERGLYDEFYAMTEED